MAKKTVKKTAPKEKTVKQEQKTSRKVSFRSMLDLQRAFAIFSVIYLPVSVLFLGNGPISELTLGIYTAMLAFTGLILIGEFIMILGASANEHKDNYGTLFVLYILNILIPLLMFKVFAYIVLRLLPHTHHGFRCDIKDFVLGMYRTFHPQETLNYVIFLTFGLLFTFTVWSVRRQQ